MPLRSITDQTGYTANVIEFPQRIVSLVPSQTELLHYLGLGDRVCGITKFCVHPESWFRSKTRVGGTKTVKFDVIRALNPDLIIANKEENTREDILALRNEYPVWTSDIYNMEDNLEMISAVSELTGKQSEGTALVENIRKKLSEVDIKNTGTALYVIWDNPIMAAGPDTYIHHILELAGLSNVLSEKAGWNRYPELTEADLKDLNPDRVLLSSEPFPFKEKHKQNFRAILPNADIRLVDGEMFSWYGSRTLEMIDYIATCLKN